MDIYIDDSTTKWLKEELGLAQGDAVRIMTRYGDSAIQPGFALTLSVESPDDVAGLASPDGIQVFVKEQDAWYFNGGDVHVRYDVSSDELLFDVR